MEDFTPVRKLSFQKKRTKKYINSSKNNNVIELHSLIPGKNNIDFDLQKKQFHSQVKKRGKAKFNSIDNVSLYFNDNNNKSKNKNDCLSPRKQKKIIKNENNYTNYCENIFLEEPHFKKSVFKKQSNKKLKNFNRKVSFLSPKGRKNQQVLNLIKTNKISKINTINLENNNDSRSKLTKLEMGNDDQSYGYDKVYNANIKRVKNDDIIKTSIFNQKEFDGRNLKRKQTNKTYKNDYTPKIRNLSKKNTTIIFKRDIKKKNTSKSNDKKLKKKSTKILKDKDKDRDKETIIKEKTSKGKNLKIISINNNININSDDKLEKNKVKKCVTIIDKNDKKNENTQKSNISEIKNKKKQDFSPKKSIDNIETIVQVEENKKINIKKLFCCVPFLICFRSNDENENIF